MSGVRAAFIAAGRDLAATGYADACPIETLAHLEVASTPERLRLATAEVFDSWSAPRPHGVAEVGRHRR